MNGWDPAFILKLHESKLLFASLIKIIRSKHSFSAAHINGVNTPVVDVAPEWQRVGHLANRGRPTS